MSGELNEKIAVAGADNFELKCIALGEEDMSEELAEVEPAEEPASVDQKLAAIELRLFHITNSIDSLFQIVKGLRDKSYKERDIKINKTIEQKKSEKKIEIPEGITLHGSTNGLSYFCQVKSDGFYVGEKRYDSLSAAAAGISGVRRSGWTFWRLSDGRTVKEVYKP